MNQRLLTPEQAAEYCGLKTVEAFTRFAAGKLQVKPVRPGKRNRLFDKKAIDKALDNLQGFPQPGGIKWS